MTTPMIEKMARIRAEQEFRDWTRLFEQSRDEAETIEEIWPSFADQAREMLTALLEPTDDMVTKSARSLAAASDMWDFREQVKVCHEAMIKAALGDA
jgi:hypothetical protein